jgi:hypothetical protein
MASIIALGELQLEIAKQLKQMADRIQPTIFPLTIRPEPVLEVREALDEALRERARKLDRFDDSELSA